MTVQQTLVLVSCCQVILTPHLHFSIFNKVSFAPKAPRTQCPS